VAVTPPDQRCGAGLYARPRATGPVIARLAEAADTYLVDQTAWQVHSNRLGITCRVEVDLAAIQDPGR
jgi:hypothetical protein